MTGNQQDGQKPEKLFVIKYNEEMRGSTHSTRYKELSEEDIKIAEDFGEKIAIMIEGNEFDRILRPSHSSLVKIEEIIFYKLISKNKGPIVFTKDYLEFASFGEKEIVEWDENKKVRHLGSIALRIWNKVLNPGEKLSSSTGNTILILDKLIYEVLNEIYRGPRKQVTKKGNLELYQW